MTGADTTDELPTSATDTIVPTAPSTSGADQRIGLPNQGQRSDSVQSFTRAFHASLPSQPTRAQAQSSPMHSHLLRPYPGLAIPIHQQIPSSASSNLDSLSNPGRATRHGLSQLAPQQQEYYQASGQGLQQGLRQNLNLGPMPNNSLWNPQLEQYLREQIVRFNSQTPAGNPMLYPESALSNFVGNGSEHGQDLSTSASANQLSVPHYGLSRPITAPPLGANAPSPLDLETVLLRLRQPSAGSLTGGSYPAEIAHPVLQSLQAIANLQDLPHSPVARPSGAASLGLHLPGTYLPRVSSEPSPTVVPEAALRAAEDFIQQTGVDRRDTGSVNRLSKPVPRPQSSETLGVLAPEGQQPPSTSLLSPFPSTSFPANAPLAETADRRNGQQEKQTNVTPQPTGTAPPRVPSIASFSTLYPVTPPGSENAPRISPPVPGPPNPLQHIDPPSPQTRNSLEAYQMIAAHLQQPDALAHLARLQELHPQVAGGNDIVTQLALRMQQYQLRNMGASASEHLHEHDVFQSQPSLYALRDLQGPYGQSQYGSGTHNDAVAHYNQLVHLQNALKHHLEMRALEQQNLERSYANSAALGDFFSDPTSPYSQLSGNPTAVALQSLVANRRTERLESPTVGRKASKLSPLRRASDAKEGAEADRNVRNPLQWGDTISPGLASPFSFNPPSPTSGIPFLFPLASPASEFPSPLGSPRLTRIFGDPDGPSPFSQDAEDSPRGVESPAEDPSLWAGEAGRSRPKKLPRGSSEGREGRAVIDLGGPRKSSRKRKAEVPEKAEGSGDSETATRGLKRRKSVRLSRNESAHSRNEQPKLPASGRSAFQARIPPPAPRPTLYLPDQNALVVGQSKYTPALQHILGEIDQLPLVEPGRAEPEHTGPNGAPTVWRKVEEGGKDVSRIDRRQLEGEAAELEKLLTEVRKREAEYLQQTAVLGARFNAALGLSFDFAESYIKKPREKAAGRFAQVRNTISANLERVRQQLALCEEELRSRRPGRNGPNKLDLRPSGLEAVGEGAGKSFRGGREMALALPKRHMSVRELKERARAIEGGAARARVGGGQRGLSRMAVSILRGWLFDHFLHPYPSDEEKEALAHATNLQKGQIANWFINARVRVWKPMIEEMYKEAKEKEVAGGGGESPGRGPDSSELPRLLESGQRSRDEEEESGDDGKGSSDSAGQLIRTRRYSSPGGSPGRPTTQDTSRRKCHTRSTMQGTLELTEIEKPGSLDAQGGGSALPPGVATELGWMREGGNQTDSGEEEAERDGLSFGGQELLGDILEQSMGEKSPGRNTAGAEGGREEAEMGRKAAEEQRTDGRGVTGDVEVHVISGGPARLTGGGIEVESPNEGDQEEEDEGNGRPNALNCNQDLEKSSRVGEVGSLPTAEDRVQSGVDFERPGEKGTGGSVARNEGRANDGGATGGWNRILNGGLHDYLYEEKGGLREGLSGGLGDGDLLLSQAQGRQVNRTDRSSITDQIFEALLEGSEPDTTPGEKDGAKRSREQRDDGAEAKDGRTDLGGPEPCTKPTAQHHDHTSVVVPVQNLDMDKDAPELPRLHEKRRRVTGNCVTPNASA